MCSSTASISGTKPDSRNFGKGNFSKMLAKALILLCTVALEGAYFAWWLYFERLKFGDLTTMCQIRQSFHSPKFLVLRYRVFPVPGIIFDA